MSSHSPVLSLLSSSFVRLDVYPPSSPVRTAVLTILLVLVACAINAKAQAFDPVAYQASYTPAVSMTVTPAASASSTNAVAAGTSAVINQAATAVQTILQGGVSTQIPLPLASNGKAAAATFTLSFGSAWAGQGVYVQPLRGGTCTATGATGSATFHHGFSATLDATGSTVVTFQPPNKPGTYKVFTRLLNVSTTFPFVVPAAGS